MGKLNLYVAVLLATGSAALVAVTFASRCAASPVVNVQFLLFGLALQATSIAFLMFFEQPFADEISKRRLTIMGMSLVIFAAGSMVVRYSVQFSDAIGKPNYFRSAGLACRNAV